MAQLGKGLVLCMVGTPEDVVATLRQLGLAPPPSPGTGVGPQQPQQEQQHGHTEYYDMAGDDGKLPPIPPFPVLEVEPKIDAKNGLENYCFTEQHTRGRECTGQEAEKFQSEDDMGMLENAKNGLENYCSTERHTRGRGCTGQAGKFQSEDDNDQRIGAETGLEKHCLTERHTLGQEAMKFQPENDNDMQSTDVKNDMENYCSTMRSAQLETSGKAFQDALDWLDNNRLAEGDGVDDKYLDGCAATACSLQAVAKNAPGCDGLDGHEPTGRNG